MVNHHVSPPPPAGRINVVDPSPLNWLYVLFNTMEEAVRTDREGKIIPSLASGWKWVDTRTLQLNLRDDALYHDQQPFTAEDVRRNFTQVKKWIAPHPPGTWLNLPEETRLEIIDKFTVRLHFPSAEGLALAKLRAHHYGNKLFWQTIGFGYSKLGSAEGHW
ncbi:ABC transporter substrate-binding protein [Bacillus sp. SG-1]|uniref:ABC transporter substrate-binding protein n=1 Tax=Bacillus sp. SG-1 TaxID=161544 RepID=UPI00015452E7|nr:ABC transporter substrate-binding protein [Bacillus sp. SG-1]EDL63515.1 hypothetical protein BSG1_13501 [Bacillus sp. SG-1]